MHEGAPTYGGEFARGSKVPTDYLCMISARSAEIIHNGLAGFFGNEISPLLPFLRSAQKRLHTLKYLAAALSWGASRPVEQNATYATTHPDLRAVRGRLLHVVLLSLGQRRDRRRPAARAGADA